MNSFKTEVNNKKLLLETLLVIIVTIILVLAFNKFKSIIILIPAAYFILDKRIRKRSWSEVGFKFKNITVDIKKNWYWLLLVGVISQPLTFFIGKYFIPGFISHVTDRVPVDLSLLIPAIIVMTISTFLEEVIFRGFIQERLSWFCGIPLSIIIASLLFAFSHYSPGNFNIVAFDLTGIFIDSILFGIIFARTKNIYAAWIGHYLGDLTGLACFLLFL